MRKRRGLNWIKNIWVLKIFFRITGMNSLNFFKRRRLSKRKANRRRLMWKWCKVKKYKQIQRFKLSSIQDSYRKTLKIIIRLIPFRETIMKIQIIKTIKFKYFKQKWLNSERNARIYWTKTYIYLKIFSSSQKCLST